MPLKSKVLGIDIGVSDIKIVIAVKSGAELVLEEVLTLPTVSQDEPSLAALLRERFNAAAFKKAHVITALPDNFVMTKTLSLPRNLNSFEIETHLLLEAEHYFGCVATDICLDFAVIPLSDELQEVQIVAAKRAEVERRKNIVQAAGLSLKAIDVAGAALIRAAEFFCPNSAVLHFTAEQLQFLMPAEKKLWQEKTLVLPAVNQDLITEIKQQLVLLPQLPATLVVTGQHPKLASILCELENSIKKPLKMFNLADAGYALSFGLALWSLS